MSISRKEALEVLGEAYDEARYGGIGDGGGSEPLGTLSGAETILDYLEAQGLEIIRKQPKK